VLVFISLLTILNEVVVIGCGSPLRSIGWYHAMQLLKNKCPSGKLVYVVNRGS